MRAVQFGPSAERNLTLLKYAWEHVYVAAILETDNKKLASRISAAKAAMFARIERLNEHRDESIDERESLAVALIGLHKLSLERLNGRNLADKWAL